MQNTIQKFRQNSIVFEKPGIWSENLKILTSSNYVEFFLFGLDLELFAKNKKKPGFYTLVHYTFINDSRSKQN